MSRKPADVASKERNEYIPSFITKKPFWVPDDGTNSTNDYLEHQRLQKETTDQARWYSRGQKQGPAATKYRKGACENCGAITHKSKDCLSRPRAKGAKWTGKDIQADESVQDVRLGWDAKRDRWNGYDAAEYRKVVEDYNELEDLKRKTKLEEAGEAQNGTASSDADEESRYAEESDMGRQQSTATRNLRLREDTAKYLLNLDLDSAKYDPKTRSMVDAGAQVDQASALVAEDNFMRASGDAAEFEKAQKYAWESQERGDKNKIHLQANPTSGEYIRRKQQKEASAKREAQRKMLLERYGGEEHLRQDDEASAEVIENDHYAEYDEAGLVKGIQQNASKSRYDEDILTNNHTSIWGSWWSNFSWGYACCHSMVKNSYCTGEDGRKALEDADHFRAGVHIVKEDMATHARSNVLMSPPSKQSEQAEVSLSKKRIFAEAQNGVSEEEIEAYKRSRLQSDDPMVKFRGTETLLG